VGEIAREYPGALEVMKDLGINHCCGAGLTLAEAAAAAGVALDRLLEALSERARTAS
jgi:iron-sulfur cluster repair protein YtfE (RIC family)